MYSYFKIYFYMSNFASIGRFDLVVFIHICPAGGGPTGPNVVR